MTKMASWWIRLKRRFDGEDGAPRESAVTRMTLIAGLLVVGFGWVLAQAAVYQVLDHDAIVQEGERIIHSQVILHGDRGRILDRTGHWSIAVTVPSRSAVFYGAPLYVNRGEIAYALAQALGLRVEEVMARLLTSESYALIKRGLTDTEVATLDRMQMRFVHVITEPSRLYPLGSVFGPVVGSVLDGRGNRGLEAFYDADLRGESDEMRVLRDARRRGLVESAIEMRKSLDGAELVLNIHPQIQFLLESELEVKVEEEKALGGMGVVLDPKTFEVLAMASVPSMDPNKVGSACGAFEASDAAAGVDNGTNPCRNKVVSFVFEPGSVAKVFALAAGIESGRITLDTQVNGHMGSCMVGRFPVSDVKKVGVVSVRDAIKYSSNCAMSEVGRMVGAEALHDTLARLGFGRPTGVDLPAEAAGVLRPAQWWRGTDAQVAAYGYSYSATQMQIATAISAIANDGLMLRPRIGRELRDQEGRVLKSFEPGVPVRVLSSRAVAAAKEAMTAVVMEDQGTGKAARPQGYTAAGKTGTARLNSTVFALPGAKKKPHIMTFAGFAPIEDPRLVVVVSVIAPQVHPYSGQVAAPVFRAVVERSLPMLGVAPAPGRAVANTEAVGGGR